MTSWRFLFLLLRHRGAFLSRLSTVMRLYALASVSTHVRIIKVDQVWCGEALEFPGMVTMVFGPGTENECALPLESGSAVSVGQQMVRWGGELLYREMKACERHGRNVGDGGSFELSRIIEAGHLDS